MNRCQRKCRMDIRKKEKVNRACLFYGGRDGGLYTPAADTYLLPSAEAVACTARSAGGRYELNVTPDELMNIRFHESRRSLGVSAAMASATPKWWQRAGVNEDT